MRQHTTPLAPLQRDFAKLVPLDATDPVVLCQALVREGVVGAEEVDYTAVCLYHIFEEQFGLLAHRSAQRAVEFLELAAVRIHQVQIPELQPLPGKIFRQGATLRVGQHPRHLRVPILAQSFRRRLPDQFVVRHAAPEEVRESRCESELVDPVDGRRIVRLGLEFVAEQKIWRHEDGYHREFHAPLERVITSAFRTLSRDVQQALNLIVPHRTAERPGGKPLQDLAGGGTAIHLGRIFGQPVLVKPR